MEAAGISRSSRLQARIRSQARRMRREFPTRPASHGFGSRKLRSLQKNTALAGGIFLKWWRRRESPGLRACKRESAGAASSSLGEIRPCAAFAPAGAKSLRRQQACLLKPRLHPRVPRVRFSPLAITSKNTALVGGIFLKWWWETRNLIRTQSACVTVTRNEERYV